MTIVHCLLALLHDDMTSTHDLLALQLTTRHHWCTALWASRPGNRPRTARARRRNPSTATAARARRRSARSRQARTTLIGGRSTWAPPSASITSRSGAAALVNAPTSLKYIEYLINYLLQSIPKLYCFCVRNVFTRCYDVLHGVTMFYTVLRCFTRRYDCSTELSNFGVYALGDVHNPVESNMRELCNNHAGAVPQSADGHVVMCDSPVTGRCELSVTLYNYV